MDYLESGYHLVLFEPQIPHNTGAIIRLCAGAGFHLHLIEPLGFSLSDRYMKRSGLDYWEYASLSVHDSFTDFLLRKRDIPLFYFSSKAEIFYDTVNYPDSVVLLFGSETKGVRGIEEELLPFQSVRIPMREGVRCYNLANSVSIGVYEVLRQNNFQGLI